MLCSDGHGSCASGLKKKRRGGGAAPFLKGSFRKGRVAGARLALDWKSGKSSPTDTELPGSENTMKANLRSKGRIRYAPDDSFYIIV